MNKPRFEKNSLIQYPSGRWGFVGTVNWQLTVVRKDGSLPTLEEAVEDNCLPGSFRKLKTRSWETWEAALAAAKECL